jgi:ABC-type enterochelin transport system permease subunit
MNHQGAGTVFFHGRGLLLFFTSAIAISTTAAQTPGVTDNGILIGSCLALDGPVRFLQNQTVLGCDNLSTFHQRRRRGFRP